MRSIPHPRIALPIAIAAAGLLAVPASTAAQSPPTAGGCPVFPADSHWNQRIDALPVARKSKRVIRHIGTGYRLHPDFGSGTWEGGRIGIPYVVVPQSQPLVKMVFQDRRYSDRGPYPIPADAPVEDRPDRHVVVVQSGTCRLYELFEGYRREDGRGWNATSGASWDLRSSKLRPDGWTSADAAGLPIFPGLVRFEEVRQGQINHALRIAVPRTRRAWVYPARHAQGQNTHPHLPAMGQRLRLKRKIKAWRYPPQARVVIEALQRYGVMVADAGAAWHLTGAPDDGWDMDQVFTLTRLKAKDFEVVDTRSLPKPGR
jgi:hypothetical protein